VPYGSVAGPPPSARYCAMYSAGWIAVRRVASNTWCRHEVPAATSASSVASSRTAGKSRRSPMAVATAPP